MTTPIYIYIILYFLCFLKVWWLWQLGWWGHLSTAIYGKSRVLNLNTQQIYALHSHYSSLSLTLYSTDHEFMIICYTELLITFALIFVHIKIVYINCTCFQHSMINELIIHIHVIWTWIQNYHINLCNSVESGHLKGLYINKYIVAKFTAMYSNSSARSGPLLLLGGQCSLYSR